MKFNFVIIYLISIVFFATPIIMNLVVLKNAGELDSIETVVQQQVLEKTLYGSGTNQNTFFYKLELLKAIKPNVVALGSSRVMQFRQEMFNTSFINTGGAINCISEAEKFVDEMLKLYTPKIVIFGLDDWWFNPNSPSSNWKNPELDSSTKITFEKIIAPYLWLYEEKITLSDYISLLVNKRNMFQSKLTLNSLLGISAIKRESGFRSDGSYFYGKMLVTTNVNDYQFKDTIRRIDSNVDRFEYSDTMLKENWDIAMNLMKKLNKIGVKTILFIPPYANSIYSIMNFNNKYKYMNEISIQASSENIYDFRNPNKLALTDCFFTDGFHGSEIAYFKLLNQIVELRPYINNLDKVDDKFKLVLPDDVTIQFNEGNILGQDCTKTKKGEK